MFEVWSCSLFTRCVLFIKVQFMVFLRAKLQPRESHNLLLVYTFLKLSQWFIEGGSDLRWQIVKISPRLAPVPTYIYIIPQHALQVSGSVVWGRMHLLSGCVPSHTCKRSWKAHAHTPFSLLVFGPNPWIMCVCGKLSHFPDPCIFQCAMCSQYLHSIQMRSWLCWLSVCSAPTWFLFTLCARQTFAQGLELVL